MIYGASKLIISSTPSYFSHFSVNAIAFPLWLLPVPSLFLFGAYFSFFSYFQHLFFCCQVNPVKAHGLGKLLAFCLVPSLSFTFFLIWGLWYTSEFQGFLIETHLYHFRSLTSRVEILNQGVLYKWRLYMTAPVFEAEQQTIYEWPSCLKTFLPSNLFSVSEWANCGNLRPFSCKKMKKIDAIHST